MSQQISNLLVTLPPLISSITDRTYKIRTLLHVNRSPKNISWRLLTRSSVLITIAYFFPFFQPGHNICSLIIEGIPETTTKSWYQKPDSAIYNTGQVQPGPRGGYFCAAVMSVWLIEIHLDNYGTQYNTELLGINYTGIKVFLHGYMCACICTYVYVCVRYVYPFISIDMSIQEFIRFWIETYPDNNGIQYNIKLIGQKLYRKLYLCIQLCIHLTDVYIVCIP